MTDSAKQFLFELLTTPSPTGFERKIQRVVKKRMQKYADTIETDLYGNLIVGLNTKAKRRVMLAGHCDQIGFMVSHITNDGFIYISRLGGVDPGVLNGARVVIHAESGPIIGVIGRKPIHIQNGEERDRMKLDLDKVWVDIGAKNKKEVEKRIRPGDCITFELNYLEMPHRFICSPGLDDKVGLFVAMEALRICSERYLDVALYSVSTVQEEVGIRGSKTSAYAVDPEVGIAIDVVTSSDNPGNDIPRATPCLLGKGPTISRGPNTNPIVEERLFAAAKKGKIPFQVLPDPRPLGNDANSIQVSRAGVATGHIGIPNRYMHTQVEICSYEDIENAAKLLARFISEITPKVNFRPE